MTSISDQVEIISLYHEAFHKAECHKWIESEKLGRDVGDAGIYDWFGKHWAAHCRNRRIQHVIGSCLCPEFQDPPSLFLNSLYQKQDLLFMLILDRLYQGWENLDVINWALDWGLPTSRIYDILLDLNINCARLEPQFA